LTAYFFSCKINNQEEFGLNKMRYIGNTPNLPKSIDFAKLEG